MRHRFLSQLKIHSHQDHQDHLSKYLVAYFLHQYLMRHIPFSIRETLQSFLLPPSSFIINQNQPLFLWRYCYHHLYPIHYYLHLSQWQCYLTTSQLILRQIRWQLIECFNLIAQHYTQLQLTFHPKCCNQTRNQLPQFLFLNYHFPRSDQLQQHNQVHCLDSIDLIIHLLLWKKQTMYFPPHSYQLQQNYLASLDCLH